MCKTYAYKYLQIFIYIQPPHTYTLLPRQMHKLSNPTIPLFMKKKN